MEPVLHVKGLLIDMDGLLLDTERVAERCWQEAEKESGFSLPPGFYVTLIGQSMRRIEERLHEIEDPTSDVKDFLKVASRIYKDRLLQDAVPVKPGARELLEYLSRQGIPTCLATSTFQDLCRHKLESTGLAQWLSLRVCGDEVHHSKPAPDIYLEAARRIGFSPSELLVLEDSENGLIAGLEAGCKVAHVPDLGPVALAVQARADRVYRDLIEVKAALERREIRID